MNQNPKIKIYNSDQYVKKPWKNGGGESEELLIFPKSDDFVWRMSVAPLIKSGSFSSYEGYMRVIIPLEGVIALLHDHDPHTEHKLAKLEAYRFQGFWKTECILKTKVARDFNFIYKPQMVAAQIGSITLKNTLPLRLNGDQDFLYCVEGGIKIECETEEAEQVEVGTHDLCEMRAQKSNQIVQLRPTSKNPTSLIHLSLKNRE